jgi:hypothetical protein
MNPGGTGNSHDPGNGGMKHMTGTVKSFSGSSFTMSMVQSSQDIAVTTDSNTQFQGMGGMGHVNWDDRHGRCHHAAGRIVHRMSGGSMAGGLVTSAEGLGQFKHAVRTEY